MAYRLENDRLCELARRFTSTINGTYSGGPLDGLSFSFETVGHLAGATLVLWLRDSERRMTPGHEYHLVPLGLTNQMQYQGELAERPEDEEAT